MQSDFFSNLLPLGVFPEVELLDYRMILILIVLRSHQTACPEAVLFRIPCRSAPGLWCLPSTLVSGFFFFLCFDGSHPHRCEGASPCSFDLLCLISGNAEHLAMCSLPVGGSLKKGLVKSFAYF